MASVEIIKQIIARIKTLYSYYAKDADVKTMLAVWEEVLGEYGDKEVAVAFKECLKSCKMPPTPADVTGKIEELKESQMKTDTELWVEFKKALNKANEYIYRFNQNAICENGKTSGEYARETVKKIFDSLSPELRIYLNNVNTLIDIARNYDSEALKFEKKSFSVRLPIIRKREKNKQMLAEVNVKGLLNSI